MCMQVTFTFACGHQPEADEDIISQCDRALQNNLPRCSDLEEQQHEMAEDCPDCQLEAELNAARQESLQYHNHQQRMAGSLGAVETDEDEDEMLRRIQELSLAEHMRTTQENEVEELRRAIEQSKREFRAPQAMDNWMERRTRQEMPNGGEDYDEGPLTPTPRAPGPYRRAGTGSSRQVPPGRHYNAMAGPSRARPHSARGQSTQDLPPSYDSLEHADVDFPEEHEIERSASAATRARWANMRLPPTSVASRSGIYDENHDAPGGPSALDDADLYEVDDHPDWPPNPSTESHGVPSSHERQPRMAASRDWRTRPAVPSAQTLMPPIETMEAFRRPYAEPRQALSRGQGITVRPVGQSREGNQVNAGYVEDTAVEEVIEDDEGEELEEDEAVEEEPALPPSPRTMRARRLTALERRRE